MEKDYKIAAGVGAVGLVAIVIIRQRLAASQAAASSSAVDTSSLSSLSSLSPVSTGGTYAVSSSGIGDSTDTSGLSGTLDSSVNTNVSSFSSLLQGILSSGADYAQASNAQAASNNATAAAAIQSVAPSPAPVSAASPAPAQSNNYQGSHVLWTNSGGYLVANAGLYAADSAYRQAWDSVSAANQQRFGTQWNAVSKGANSSDLNNEIVDYYAQHYPGS